MNAQRGNILFLILLAIILFVALSYAITSSQREQVSGIPQEKAKALAGTIMNMLTNTEVGLQRFLVSKELRIEQIDLYNSANTSYGDNSNCTTASCNLFDPAGGGVTIPILPIEAFGPTYTGCTQPNSLGIRPLIRIVNFSDVGTTAGDIALTYCGIRPEICEEINIAMGLRKKGDAIIAGWFGNVGDGNNPFNGNMNPIPEAPTVNITASSDSRVAGARTFCREVSGAGGPILMHVIYAR